MRYRLLGNSGLRVSEAALGTMTFGDDWGWGSAKEEARKVYEAFRESRVDLGFPYDFYGKELSRTFIYGGLRDQISA